MTHSLIAPNTLRQRPRPPRPRRHNHAQPPTPTLQAILFYFGTSLPQKKGGRVGSGRAAAAAKIRSCHSSSSARQGKRDQYNRDTK